MNWTNIHCKLYSQDSQTNRKNLFEEALHSAKSGKVLYIVRDELNELPELSNNHVSFNRHCMRMISFLYAKTPESLVECLTSLSDWNTTPSTIILDELCSYCDKNDVHTACALVSLLVDSIKSCSEVLKLPCKLFISISREVVEEDYYNVLQELYFNYTNNDTQELK